MGWPCVLPHPANALAHSRVCLPPAAGLEAGLEPKNRTWSVVPLFSLEPVGDATDFNVSLPQSATKTVRVLSTNSTSFTARVVGAAESNNRTTFQPVIRVLPGSVRTPTLGVIRSCRSIVGVGMMIPCGSLRERLTGLPRRDATQNGAKAVLEVTVDSMAVPKIGNYTAVVAVRDRSVLAGVMSELEVLLQV
jgi:hypothetical protein